MPTLRMGHLLAEVLFGGIGLCYLFLDFRFLILKTGWGCFEVGLMLRGRSVSFSLNAT